MVSTVSEIVDEIDIRYLQSSSSTLSPAYIRPVGAADDTEATGSATAHECKQGLNTSAKTFVLTIDLQCRASHPRLH